MSLCEIDQQIYRERSGQVDRRASRIRAEVTSDAAVEKIISDAKAKSPKMSGISDASRVKNIRGNRAVEKAINRQAEVFRPGGIADPGGLPSSNVVAFHSAASAMEDDYSAPSIAEILGEEAGDE